MKQIIDVYFYFVFLLWLVGIGCYYVCTVIRCNLFWIIFPCLLFYVAGQQNVEDSNRIVWCTVNSEEQRKCLNFARAVERDWNLFGSAAMRLECKQVCFVN